MKKLLALLLIACMLTPIATLADERGSENRETLYVCNPDPADRLHLRELESTSSRSYGKYYNGTPVQVVRSSASGWAQVVIGIGTEGIMTGYMQSRYLLDSEPPHAMPVYRISSTHTLTVHSAPDTRSPSRDVHASDGVCIALMGFSEDWWHVAAIDLENGKTRFTGLVSNAESSALIRDERLDRIGEEVQLANPDKRDRLHLRVSPNKSSKSLGKYYNGSVGVHLGQANDEWTCVSMYGQKGYMLTKYLCFWGQTNTCYYGIPTVSAIRDCLLYEQKPNAANGRTKSLHQGQQLEVLGLDESYLHVQLVDDALTGFVAITDTDFVDD